MADATGAPERRLVLLRHAKSSWNSGASTDHERPLSGRGRRDAPRVAAKLAELSWVPDAVFASDSRRTRETWERMESRLSADVGRTPHVEFDPALYHAGLDELRTCAERWDPGWRTVLALGHNPGWEAAVRCLSREDQRLTTCNAVLLAGLGCNWSEALGRGWRLVQWIRPRELA